MEVGRSGSERERVERMSKGPIKSRDMASGNRVKPILNAFGLDPAVSVDVAIVIECCFGTSSVQLLEYSKVPTS